MHLIAMYCNYLYLSTSDFLGVCLSEPLLGVFVGWDEHIVGTPSGGICHQPGLLGQMMFTHRKGHFTCRCLGDPRNPRAILLCIPAARSPCCPELTCVLEFIVISESEGIPKSHSSMNSE
jgi:hypothetical protein